MEKMFPGVKKTERIVEILILVSVFSCFIYYNLARGVVGLTALYFLFNTGVRKKIFAYKSFYIICGFVLYAFIVALFNKNFLGAFASLSFMAMMIVAFTARSIMTKRFYEQLFDVMILGGCAATVGSIIERLINYDVPGYRCQVFSSNPNFFGICIAIVIMVCAYKAVTATEKVYIYYVAAVFNAVGVVLCGSYSLFPTAALCIIIFLLCSRKYKLLAIFLGIGVVAAVVIFSFPQLLIRLNEMGATTDNRMKIWSFALENIKKQPVFGHGFVGYLHLYNMMHYTREIYKASLCHNVLIDIMLCHGIVGMGIIISFVTCYIKSIVHFSFKKISSEENRTVIKFIIAVLIAIFCYGMLDTTFVWIQSGTMILLIAAGIGLAENDAKKQKL